MTGTATDLAGNTASVSVSVSIDKTAPELFVQFDPASKDVQVFGRDGLSGVEAGAIAPLQVTPPPGRRENNDDDDDGRMDRRTYRATDLAGNTLTIVLKVKREGRELQARIISWSYQNGPAAGPPLADAPRNRFNLEWNTNRDGSLRELEQLLSIYSGPNQQEVDADYDAARNQTTIRVSDSQTRIVRPGLVLLKLTTNRGELEIEY